MGPGNPSGREGMIAGGMAMLAALLAMQLLSRIIGPQPMLTDYLAPLAQDGIDSLPGDFTRFLMNGDDNFSRMVVLLMVLLVMIGAGLGTWSNATPGFISQRAMQSAAIVLFGSLALLYIADRQTVENYLQQIAITLALSCLVFAFTLNWLLQANLSPHRWRIGVAVSLISVIVIGYDVFA